MTQTDDAYNTECRQFVEDIRNLFGAGYGEGHQTSDFLRIIRATRSYMLRMERRADRYGHILGDFVNFAARQSAYTTDERQRRATELCAMANAILDGDREIAPPKAWRAIRKTATMEQRDIPSAWTVFAYNPSTAEMLAWYDVEELR